MAEGDDDAEGDTEAEGDGEAERDGETEVEGDGEAEGEADGDGDALGGEDPAAADTEPTTRWPAGICAEPVVTSGRDPTGGGARAGTGAGCPLMLPAATLVCVADAGT